MKNHILGIGGLFFRAKDPEKLAVWYKEHFDIPDGSVGNLWEQQAGPTVFSAFKDDTDYFGSEKQQFMINFRVHDLDGLLETLRAKDVKINEKRQEEEYGRFAWVYDPENNKIELWEPPQ